MNKNRIMLMRLILKEEKPGWRGENYHSPITLHKNTPHIALHTHNRMFASKESDRAVAKTFSTGWSFNSIPNTCMMYMYEQSTSRVW